MKRLLLDTNVLLLLVVGKWSEDAIATFRRTNQFTHRHFRLLTNLLPRYVRLATTQASGRAR
jgi:hypothetical protein